MEQQKTYLCRLAIFKGCRVVKLIVFSDTHRKIDECINVLRGAEGVGAVLHAGDMACDARDLASVFPDLPFYFVAGNNDFFDDSPHERVLTLGGVKILLTHGHTYGVRYGVRELGAYAKKSGAELAVFGHTHKAFDGFENGVRLLNPGTMGYAPRSYAEIVIEDRKIQTKIISCC